MQPLGKACQWNHKQSNIVNRQKNLSAPCISSSPICWWQSNGGTRVQLYMYNKYLGHHLADMPAYTQVQRHHYSLVVNLSTTSYSTPPWSARRRLTMTLSMCKHWHFQCVMNQTTLFRHDCHWLLPSVLGLCLSDKLRFWTCMVIPTAHIMCILQLDHPQSCPLRTLAQFKPRVYITFTKHSCNI